MKIAVFCNSCLLEMEFEYSDGILYCRCPHCEREMRERGFEHAYEPRDDVLYEVDQERVLSCKQSVKNVESR